MPGSQYVTAVVDSVFSFWSTTTNVPSAVLATKQVVQPSHPGDYLKFATATVETISDLIAPVIELANAGGQTTSSASRSAEYQRRGE